MLRWITAAAASGLLLAGCGSQDEKAATDTPPAAAAASAAAATTYTPVSDVTQHAAVGKDMAEIRALAKPEGEGVKPDYEAAAKIWSEGKNSTKGDGSKRTLAGFVEDHPVGKRVGDALAGTGAAKDLDDAQRGQWIDKGMIVALKVKVLDELDGAAEGLAKGEVDPQTGAPHKVDEAWAFFTADDEGIEVTAAKRAEDFGLPEQELGKDVTDAISAAAAAIKADDEEAFKQAQERARGGLNRIFALATKKYAVEGAKPDATKERAEGLAFSWGLTGELDDTDTKRVEAAFDEKAGAGAAADVAKLLDAAAPKLGFEGPLPEYPAAG